jgi:hypothetical protein
MEWSAVAKKFIDCTSYEGSRWTRGRAESMIEIVDRLELVDDVSNLTKVLSDDCSS